MSAMALAERYATNLHGVLSCFDRIIITGTLPGARSEERRVGKECRL